MVFWAGTPLLFYAVMNYANLLKCEARGMEKNCQNMLFILLELVFSPCKYFLELEMYKHFYLKLEPEQNY